MISTTSYPFSVEASQVATDVHNTRSANDGRLDNDFK